jgi:hypothetical protein
MTPAERAYRLALLAYPAAYRRERGLEILTTILDAGDKRWPPRGRELLAIVLDGVARRGHPASGGSRAGSLRAGVRLAVFAWFWAYAVVGVTDALYPVIGRQTVMGGPAGWQNTYFAVLALAPLLALARAWWLGAFVIQLAATALWELGVPWDATWAWQVGGNEWKGASLFALNFVPAIACAVARPRAGEPGDARSIRWAPGAIAVGALLAWQGLFFSSWLGRPLAVALVGAVLLARRDPRLAAGAGCLAAFLAVQLLLDPYGTPWLGTSSLLAPLLIALALACGWRLRPAAAVC